MSNKIQILASTILECVGGNKTAGEVSVGDYLFSISGLPTKVIEVSRLANAPSCTVEFTGNLQLICGVESKIPTRTPSQRNRNTPHTPKEIGVIGSTILNKHGQKDHEVMLLESPIHRDKNELVIGPYTMGCLLGDGTFRGTTLVISNPEIELISEVAKEMPDGYEVVQRISNGVDYNWALTRPGTHGSENILIAASKNLGLMGKMGSDKHIPEIYLTSSIEDRVRLLGGMLDTDGWVGRHRSGKSRCQFYTTSQQLAHGLVRLVSGLGGVSTVRLRNYSSEWSTKIRPKLGYAIKHNFPMYVLEVVLPKEINPHLVSRKKDLHDPPTRLRMITSVLFTGDCQDLVVITTDSGSYVTEMGLVMA